MKKEIYQIYYSEETKNQVDTSFHPLDNSSNLRPDWREYWPIRHFLLNNHLENDVMYGFFSPKFKLKTKLNGFEVNEYISGLEGEYDIVNFSPYYDLAVFYQNIFEQACSEHRDVKEKFNSCISKIFPEINISSLTMNSGNTIFCNYFTAKKDFWIEWFYICEKIYAWSENDKSELFQILNSPTNHGEEIVDFKVFLVERIASILAISKHKRINKYSLKELPYGSPAFNYQKHNEMLMLLDSYKHTYTKTNKLEYLKLFSDLRQKIIK